MNLIGEIYLLLTCSIYYLYLFLSICVSNFSSDAILRFYGSFRATNTMMNAKEVSIIIAGPAIDVSYVRLSRSIFPLCFYCVLFAIMQSLI